MYDPPDPITSHQVKWSQMFCIQWRLKYSSAALHPLNCSSVTFYHVDVRHEKIEERTILQTDPDVIISKPVDNNIPL